MLLQDLIYLAGDIILLTAIPALGLFVGFYYFGSPWRALLVGRSLMYFAVSLLAIIAVVALSVWLGRDYFLREWVRALSYAVVSITTWRLFFTLRHIQKQSTKDVTDIGLSSHPVTEATKGSVRSRFTQSRRPDAEKSPAESTSTEKEIP